MEQAADHGTPRQVTVARDGTRVAFLRSTADGRVDQLWAFDVDRGTQHVVVDTRALDTRAPDARAPDATPPAGASAPGRIASYAIDGTSRAAVVAAGGRLYHADLSTGVLVPLATAGPASDPKVDPTGEWVGYLTGGSLRVRRLAGGQPGQQDTLLAGEPDPAEGGQPSVSWGRAGWWWAPDGRRVLAARVDARRPEQASLHLLDLDGGWVDVHWDRETYPSLVSAGWDDHPSPVVAVLRRSQQHGLVLAIDPRTGETQVHAELADPRWVEPVPGTPRHLPDGRVLVGGELAHDGYDARCLFADGTLLTPSSLYVRRVVGRLASATGILVEASGDEPAEQHLYQVDTSVSAAGIDIRRITAAPGWHRGEVGGDDTVVIGSQSLDHAGTRWTVWRGGTQVGQLSSAGPVAGSTPRPHLQRVTDRRLPTGVLYPSGHMLGRRLPVLVEATGLEQGVRAVRQPWLARQWWTGEGFAVVSVDHRGTPGVAPSFEKVVHRRLADLALADLTEALLALSGKHTDLDLDRLAITGRGIGGWVAALAVLRRPDVFRCAIAEAPLVDWSGADRIAAERYLGPAMDGPEVYQHHSLLAAAGEPPGPEPPRPLLLVPDAATEEPVRRLAGALRAAGRPHQVLTGGDGATRTRRAKLDFLRRHLR